MTGSAIGSEEGERDGDGEGDGEAAPSSSMSGDLEVVGRRRARVWGYFQDAELFGMHLHFVACGGRRVRRRWEIGLYIFTTLYYYGKYI